MQLKIERNKIFYYHLMREAAQLHHFFMFIVLRFEKTLTDLIGLLLIDIVPLCITDLMLSQLPAGCERSGEITRMLSPKPCGTSQTGEKHLKHCVHCWEHDSLYMAFRSFL